MEEKRFWRPYRVVALLPKAEELKLLGFEKEWQPCVLTPDNGFITASVDELKGTMFNVSHFSFTAPEEYVNMEKRRASVLCTPGGNKLHGRSYERGGIQYISGLRHFVLVTTNCFRRRDDVITEWEITIVRFDKESRNGHSIQIIEEISRFPMPTSLRARYTLGDRMTNHLPTVSEVVAEILKTAKDEKADERKNAFNKFANAMAVTYCWAFGGEAEMPEREDQQVQAVAEEVVEETQTEEPLEAEEPEETEVLQATGTDDVVPLLEDRKAAGRKRQEGKKKGKSRKSDDE